MPELLRLQTPDFDFSVWANNINARVSVYKTTLAKRAEVEPVAHVHFSPALKLVKSNPPTDKQPPVAVLPLRGPLFFENTQYQVEWIFFKPVTLARLTHRSQMFNEAFRFVEKSHTSPARLTGTINTGNDVGWMCLPLQFECEGHTYTQQIAFEVLPTKMALHQDLPAMYQAIDRTFPLWRFSLVEKTEQNVAQSKQRGLFPLMWLANFSQLRARFDKGLKVICAAPHSRLEPTVANIKAAKLKGRLSYQLAEQVKQDFANGQNNRHYRVEKKQLSVDTPENRFIKMVVTQCKTQLAAFEKRLRHSNQAPDQQRLSDAFLNELHSWQQPLKKILNQSFLNEVGPYTGLKRESLVLQQKTGYSEVYRVWQELKFYLDVFGSQSRISMKSVAEIYEIWCFLCLKQMLENDLGFVLIDNYQAALSPNNFFEYQLKDGFAGAFKFKRTDGVTARLAHEPLFSKNTAPIKTFLVSQKPDIVLEVTLPSTGKTQKEKQFIWLFDAKYRIKTNKSPFDEENIDHIDYVPDDALNQMHRYRDALIRLSSSNNAPHHPTDIKHKKSRPVFGAFALYPGFFDQACEINPYAEPIDEIGIGAFALLPSSMMPQSATLSGHHWLLAFLQAQIGGRASQKATSATPTLTERLYVQDAARIPYDGMQQVLYPDLTMTMALGGKSGRNNDYFEAFERNTAQWYHLPQKTFLATFKQHIAEEIRYLALASTSDTQSTAKKIDKLWPVKNVSLVPRHAITAKQAGKISTSAEWYYLFELGSPLMLKNAITHVPHTPIKNAMKLTTLTRLENIATFRDIETVYQDAMA